MGTWQGVSALFLSSQKNTSELEVEGLFSKLSGLLRGGNEICADCGGRPISAISINLGIFICSKCEFAHSDALKPHISTLIPIDSIRLEDTSSWLRYDGAKRVLLFIQRLGNKKGNELWEATYNPSLHPVHPTPQSDHKTRVDWLTQKYISALYMGPYEREVIVKVKGKPHLYFLRFTNDGTISLYTDPNRIDRTEVIQLTSANIRPFLLPTGDLECFELHTRQSQYTFFGEDRMTLFELLLTLHRAGCMIFSARYLSKSSVWFSFFFFSCVE
jgi:hypothetical protein